MFTTKRVLLKFSAIPATLLSAASAHAAGESAVEQMFAAIDLTTVAASVIGVGVLIIGVRMAFKGVDLGKRGVAKV